MLDLSYAGWFGLFAPQATSDEIVNRISAASRTAMADPALQETYRSQGMEPDADSSPGIAFFCEIQQPRCVPQDQTKVVRGRFYGS